jgi:hypothetical protein
MTDYCMGFLFSQPGVKEEHYTGCLRPIVLTVHNKSYCKQHAQDELTRLLKMEQRLRVLIGKVQEMGTEE